MVSTRQQSNIGGGADNSGSGSGSESSGSTGSSKSLRHHTSAGSNQSSSANSNGSNISSNINNSNNNHDTQSGTSVVRSSTRQQNTSSTCLYDNSGSRIESGLEPVTTLVSSKCLRHFTSSSSVGGGSNSNNNNNNHDAGYTSNSVQPRSSASTRLHSIISSTSSTIDHPGTTGFPSDSSTTSYTLTKSLRHHSSSVNQNSSSSSAALLSTNVINHNTSNNPHENQISNQLQTVYVSNTRLLDLPHEVLEKIFSYIGYKNVSHMRLVCRQLDRVCGSILNSTFQRLQTQMLHRFQSIKAKMPRRESARRNHPLACESDIIETLHMRLTLLQMSFGKHIERKHCCFFAGEILDEVYRILHYIRVTPKLARPYKVTDELFDLSTMAMEYFKEHIEPTLPEIAYFGTDFLDFTGSIPYLPSHGQGNKSGDESPGHTLGHSSDERPPEPCPTPQSNIVLRKRIRKIKQGMKRYSYQLGVMRRELRQCKGKLSEQQKQIHEYASRLDENDKKNEETSRKFSTLLQELNKCKTELQYWRSKSPLNPMCVGCGKLAAPLPNEEIGQVQVLPNQGVGIIHAELAIGEEPCLDPGFPVTLPGTSTDEVWNTWSNAEQENINKTPISSVPPPLSSNVPDQPEDKPRASVSGGKRKASCDMKNVKSTKKPRTAVFKFRSKRH